MMLLTLTAEQTARADRIVSAWSAMRGDFARRATRSELIDFLLQREEDELQRMSAGDALEQPIALLPAEPAPPLSDAEAFDLLGLNQKLAEQYAEKVTTGLRALLGEGV